MPSPLFGPRSGARIRRLPGGLRLVDVRAPHLADARTRRLVAAALPPPPAGPGGHERRVADMFTLADRVVVLGDRAGEVRGWTAYTMLQVHRRSVMWVHAAAGPDPAIAALLAVRVAGEWLRRGCRPMVVAGTSRRPAAVAASCADDVGPLAEALGSWMLSSRWASPVPPDADAPLVVLRASPRRLGRYLAARRARPAAA